MNIEGKRSGIGFVAHKDLLVGALSTVLAERLAVFNDVTVGRRGFTAYLKALAGSNIVKVVPANGSAGESQVAEKAAKVVCGSHQGYIPDGAWIKDKTPHSYAEVHVSPRNAVMPNVGSVELAEALSKVLPFTSSDQARPVLQCAQVVQKDNRLTFTGCDGFSLSEVNLSFDEGEAEALIYASELKGLIPALRKSRRVKLGIEDKANDNGAIVEKFLVVETDLIRYRFRSQDGTYPNYEQIIPTEFTATASFDSKELIRASRSLLTIWYDDSLKPLYRPLTLTVAEGKIVVEAKGERGQAEIAAETTGEATIAVEGKRLLVALKACGGMVDLSIVDEKSAMLLTVDSHRCLVMPMFLPKEEAKAEAETEAKGETEAERKGKPRRKRKAKPKAEGEAEEETEGETVAEEEAEAVGVA